VLSAALETGVEAPPHPPPGVDARDELTTEFSVATMEGTAFEDLWVRLGPDASTLYCHQVRWAGLDTLPFLTFKALSLTFWC
jgi:hypothetical protein